MNDVMKKILGENWKTNLAAIAAFVMGIPAAVGAITNWAHHEPADWRGAAVALVVAAGLACAKDSTTHSTTAEVATPLLRIQQYKRKRWRRLRSHLNRKKEHKL